MNEPIPVVPVNSLISEKTTPDPPSLIVPLTYSLASGLAVPIPTLPELSTNTFVVPFV